VPTQLLLAVTAELAADWTLQPKAIPQSGLGMIQLNDSAFDEPFYLGEFPLASAWVEVRTADGQVAEGAAQIMDDRIELAETLALCDAVLSARLPGWEQLAELLQQGMEIIETTRQERKQMLASTRVDFSLLDDMGDDDADY
jgi:alpha-D-ribose 1-methylphosphonate 5-triphosphate synthase subunit PhnG